jgi:hypothetical protein
MPVVGNTLGEQNNFARTLQGKQAYSDALSAALHGDTATAEKLALSVAANPHLSMVSGVSAMEATLRALPPHLIAHRVKSLLLEARDLKNSEELFRASTPPERPELRVEIAVVLGALNATTGALRHETIGVLSELLKSQQLNSTFAAEPLVKELLTAWKGFVEKENKTEFLQTINSILSRTAGNAERSNSIAESAVKVAGIAVSSELTDSDSQILQLKSLIRSTSKNHLGAHVILSRQLLLIESTRDTFFGWIGRKANWIADQVGIETNRTSEATAGYQEAYLAARQNVEKYLAASGVADTDARMIAVTTLLNDQKAAEEQQRLWEYRGAFDSFRVGLALAPFAMALAPSKSGMSYPGFRSPSPSARSIGPVVPSTTNTSQPVGRANQHSRARIAQRNESKPEVVIEKTAPTLLDDVIAATESRLLWEKIDASTKEFKTDFVTAIQQAAVPLPTVVPNMTEMGDGPLGKRYHSIRFPEPLDDEKPPPQRRSLISLGPRIEYPPVEPDIYEKTIPERIQIGRGVLDFYLKQLDASKSNVMAQAIQTWPAFVADRFYFEISAKPEDISSQFRTGAEWHQSLSLPIDPTVPWRRVNGTHQDAVDFQRTFTSQATGSLEIKIEGNTVQIPHKVIDKAREWARTHSHNLETETTGHFEYKLSGRKIVIVDFIPLPGLSVSLAGRKGDFGEGQMSVVTLNELGAADWVASYNDEKKLYMNFHSHFTKSAYQSRPSPPDHVSAIKTGLSAVWTPNPTVPGGLGNLIFYTEKNHITTNLQLEAEAKDVMTKFLKAEKEGVNLSQIGAGAGNQVFSAGRANLQGNKYAVLLSKGTGFSDQVLLNEKSLLEWGGPRGLTPTLHASGFTPSGRRFLIEDLIPGRTLSSEALRNPHTQRQVINLLKSLHTAKLTIPSEVTAEDRLTQIVQKIRNYDPNSLTLAQKVAMQRFLHLADRASSEMREFTKNLELVPVHNDVQPANLMQKNGKIILIDAEPTSMGWAFADVANAGLHFGGKGRLKEGLQKAADLYGIKPGEQQAYLAAAYFKFARRAGFVLSYDLLSKSSPTAENFDRFNQVLEDADVAYRLAKAARPK